jgi:hypothetical protein
MNKSGMNNNCPLIIVWRINACRRKAQGTSRKGIERNPKKNFEQGMSNSEVFISSLRYSILINSIFCGSLSSVPYGPEA